MRRILGEEVAEAFRLTLSPSETQAGLHSIQTAPWRPVILGTNQGARQMAVHEEILEEFRQFAKTAATVTSLMEHISHALHDQMARYNWVGFYEVDPNDSGMLVCGPYAGSFTPNIRIPLNIGLCGTAASTGQTVVVDDVSKDPRYLAGSSMVKSEIVVPIFANKELAAELDVESYFTSTFTPAEQTFVQACAAVVERYIAGA